MTKKQVAPKTVTVVIVAFVVLGGGIVLFHSSSSLVSQNNSTHKIYMPPDQTPSLGERTVGSQEKLSPFRDSPTSADQTQALLSPDSSNTNTNDRKIKPQATVDLWEELVDELERQWLLEKLAEIGFDDPEQQEELATWPLPVLRWQVENLKAKVNELVESGAITIEPTQNPLESETKSSLKGK